MNPYYAVDSALLTQLKWVRIEFNEPVSSGRVKDAFFDSKVNSYVITTYAWVPPSQSRTLSWIKSRREWATWDDEVPKFSTEERWAIDLHRSLVDGGLDVNIKTRPSGDVRIMVRDHRDRRHGVFTYWNDQNVYPNSQAFVLAMAAYHYFFGPAELGRMEQAIRGAA